MMKRKNSWLRIVAAVMLIGLALSAAVPRPAQAAQSGDGVLRVYGAGGPRAPIADALALFEQRTGTPYELVVGPTGQWLEKARQDGDLVFMGAEYVMDAFQEGRTYAGDTRLITENLIIRESRESLYERGPAVLVRPGNPLGISKFEDLARPGMRILVVQGAGQTGMWEDMAAFARLVPQIRENIFVIAADGADAIQKWNTVPELNAWITYESWGYRLPDTTTIVQVKEKVKIYRGTPIAILHSTDQMSDAQAFIEFLQTPEVHQIFIRWGWR